MIIDSTTAAAARPQAPPAPPDKAEPLQARPVEGTEGSLTTRLDVQREKKQRRSDMEGQGEKPETRPQTYNAKGTAKEATADVSGKRASSESVDLFV